MRSRQPVILCMKDWTIECRGQAKSRSENSDRKHITRSDRASVEYPTERRREVSKAAVRQPKSRLNCGIATQRSYALNSQLPCQTLVSCVERSAGPLGQAQIVVKLPDCGVAFAH